MTVLVTIVVALARHLTRFDEGAAIHFERRSRIGGDRPQDLNQPSPQSSVP
jgi:hypothetical protein